MSKLNEREKELVALGAAIASNCVPCVEYHVPAADKAGLSGCEIKEAIQIADKVRRTPARRVMQAALARIDESAKESAGSAQAGCGCSEPG